MKRKVNIMKKMNKGITINNMYFNWCIFEKGEIVKPYYRDGADPDEIYEVYGRPSSYKVKAWKAWVEWFNKTSSRGDDWMQITGHNTFNFTICGVITPYLGAHYMFRITRDYSLIEEVVCPLYMMYKGVK